MLASFLDGHAKQLDLEIPEFKDRPAVPRGKNYEERATEIRLKKGNRTVTLLAKGEHVAWGRTFDRRILTRRLQGQTARGAWTLLVRYRGSGRVSGGLLHRWELLSASE